MGGMEGRKENCNGYGECEGGGEVWWWKGKEVEEMKIMGEK